MFNMVKLQNWKRKKHQKTPHKITSPHQNQVSRANKGSDLAHFVSTLGYPKNPHTTTAQE